jgi:polar amino acid transport system substrate-binding protein
MRLSALSVAVLLVGGACGNSGGTKAAGQKFRVIHAGHLTVGSDIPYPPFEFEDKSGNLTGFDVELARAIAQKLGLQNTDNDWLSVDFGTIFQQLNSGTKFDVVIAAVTAYATPGSPAAKTVADRKKIVDFSKPYYPSLQSLTVNETKHPEIKTIDDLNGLRVGVQRATTGAFYAQEKLAPKGAQLVSFPKAPTLYQELLSGQVDAVLNDLPVSLDAVKGKPDLKVVQQVETGEQYAIAINKKNPQLTVAINKALDELFKDGTYTQVFEKYFPAQQLPPYASR